MQRKQRLTIRAAVVLAVAVAGTSAWAGPIRFAQYNASLNRGAAGVLEADLNGTSVDVNAALRVTQAKTVAEIIQRNSPDVLLINEFDFVPGHTPGLATHPLNRYADAFLNVPQNNVLGTSPSTPVSFPHRFNAPSNTGVHSGFDLNNNGVVVSTPGAPGYGDDAFGFGNFEGQFGMAFYSKHPIVGVRTFQNFLWKDMPGNLLTNDPTPDNPATPVNENLGGFYSPEEQGVLRLSSKSHWDVALNVEGVVVHVLVSHPTPPVFDGPEDRNGKRNFDEIRFWKDYVNGASYMYDDAGMTGGLAAGSAFVIMGDQNADPFDGDAYTLGGVRAIDQLLKDPLVDDSMRPISLGGPQQAGLQGGANAAHLGDPMFDTADFADNAPGNLRADYVLPSGAVLETVGSGIFWPENTDPLFPLVGLFTPSLGVVGGFPSSDHKMIFRDVVIPEPGSMVVLAGVGAMCLLRRRA